MNPIRKTIGYADMSWNPVTGCRHGCAYCYARGIAKRFSRAYWSWGEDVAAQNHAVNRWPGNPYPYGFVPTFHPHRLDEPKRRRKPSVIFAVDMGDLFGEWVPVEWIEPVLQVIRETPRHHYLLLTKNPARYAEFELPPNAWAGTTVAGDDDGRRLLDLADATWPPDRRWVSYEPALGPFPTRLRVHIGWLVIGAQTGPGARPPRGRVAGGGDRRDDDCRRARVPEV
ncbi:MAG: DUF5131 family protein [Bacillota bacterium]|nr:MAG: DUF5131 family protein [Bacillota bacterium]